MARYALHSQRLHDRSYHATIRGRSVSRVLPEGRVGPQKRMRNGHIPAEAWILPSHYPRVSIQMRHRG
jgi:hypothetical protein